MNDKIKVPHEYLDTLRHIRDYTTRMGQVERTEVMDALIAAAEADAPPLPEGWVLSVSKRGTHRTYWHKGGNLYSAMQNREGCGFPITTTEAAVLCDRLTPLRPTITEADVEKVARAARAAYFQGADALDAAHPDMGNVWMKTARATLDALGIEVTS